MSRYGGAIERDLARQGIDLAQMWQSRRWRKLLNIIEGLPSSSHFVDAIANDEERAHDLAGMSMGSDNHQAYRVSEFGMSERILADIADLIGQLTDVTLGVNGGRPPPRKPYHGRPRTAIERARARWEYDERQIKSVELLNKIFPDGW